LTSTYGFAPRTDRRVSHFWGQINTTFGSPQYQSTKNGVDPAPGHGAGVFVQKFWFLFWVSLRVFIKRYLFGTKEHT
jgi:hypothetical protein